MHTDRRSRSLDIRYWLAVGAGKNIEGGCERAVSIEGTGKEAGLS